MPETCLLIGDIGGTNARFALAHADAPQYSHAATLLCADFPTVHAAVHAYLHRVGAPRPEVVCLAGAGPIENDAIDITNNHWVLERAALTQALGTERIRLLNDFEAIAYALPLVGPEGCLPIGPRRAEIADRDIAVCALGPGTGLGGVGLLRRQGVLVPIAGEVGHVGFSPHDELQLAVLELLRERYSRVSNERLVSGSGIVNVYAAISTLAAGDIGDGDLTAAAIFERAAAGTDVVAEQTVELFFQLLGQVAGDVALTLGAWDGVFLAGGIAKRYPDALQVSKFRHGFENKGRHRAIMECIPTELIVRDEPGLLGAGHCARTLLRA